MFAPQGEDLESKNFQQSAQQNRTNKSSQNQTDNKQRETCDA